MDLVRYRCGLGSRRNGFSALTCGPLGVFPRRSPAVCFRSCLWVVVPNGLLPYNLEGGLFPRTGTEPGAASRMTMSPRTCAFATCMRYSWEPWHTDWLPVYGAHQVVLPLDCRLSGLVWHFWAVTEYRFACYLGHVAVEDALGASRMLCRFPTPLILILPPVPSWDG